MATSAWIRVRIIVTPLRGCASKRPQNEEAGGFVFSRVRGGEAKGLGRRRTRSGKNVRRRKMCASISTNRLSCHAP